MQPHSEDSINLPFSPERYYNIAVGVVQALSPECFFTNQVLLPLLDDDYWISIKDLVLTVTAISAEENELHLIAQNIKQFNSVQVRPDALSVRPSWAHYSYLIVHNMAEKTLPADFLNIFATPNGIQQLPDGNWQEFLSLEEGITAVQQLTPVVWRAIFDTSDGAEKAVASIMSRVRSTTRAQMSVSVQKKNYLPSHSNMLLQGPRQTFSRIIFRNGLGQQYANVVEHVPIIDQGMVPHPHKMHLHSEYGVGHHSDVLFSQAPDGNQGKFSDVGANEGVTRDTIPNPTTSARDVNRTEVVPMQGNVNLASTPPQQQSKNDCEECEATISISEIPSTASSLQEDKVSSPLSQVAGKSQPTTISEQAQEEPGKYDQTASSNYVTAKGEDERLPSPGICENFGERTFKNWTSNQSLNALNAKNTANMDEQISNNSPSSAPVASRLDEPDNGDPQRFQFGNFLVLSEDNFYIIEDLSSDVLLE